MSMSTTFQEQRQQQHGSKSKKLSRSLFILATYSLTGAAMMGSSVGLVVYQTRQFFFLNRITRLDLLYPEDHHSLSLSPDITSIDRFDSSSHPLPSHKHFYPHSLRSVLLSVWLPVFIWLGVLFLSSILISRRKWVPTVISARSGILISQVVFTFLWINLGAVQEVQEQLITKLGSAFKGMDKGLMGGVNQALLEVGTQIRTIMVPLCMIWSITVILLGGATGLLTASSSLLEKQLEEAYEDAQLEEELERLGTKLGEEEGYCNRQEKEKHDFNNVEHQFHAATTSAQKTGKSSWTLYSVRQRVMMGFLVLVLFSSQMKLFHWVVHTQSLVAYQAGTNTSVSSSLTLIGLMSGAVMISLGVRHIPRL
ncbi:hypothetical protein BGZ65_003426 [Modicella reniformis]|uniref:Uncharacterized protein n=1 Tax=Modicella reniformis TaxID=1440133 RepID=A0A9P6MHM5_9FUNG|nr:hypothetical protein BGZ65_003426 [Modicella reniformis]